MISDLKYRIRKYTAITFCLWLNCLFASAQSVGSVSEYMLGTGIGDFTRLADGSLPHNVGTYGYANYKNPIDTTITRHVDGIEHGVHLPIKSRVMVIQHQPTGSEVIYVLLDLAFASDNIRREILQHIRKDKPEFLSSHLIISATHTHSAPGGFTDYMGYEVATPGYRPDIVSNIAVKTYDAIQKAWANMTSVNLAFAERTVADEVPIAFSRKALDGYNNNPEITEPVSIEENYKATDRLWQLIQFNESNGKLHSVLNFFGAHPNRMGADIISSDTRGAASDSMESRLPENGIAIFAQNAPGDIDSEGGYRGKTDPGNTYVHAPAYHYTNDEGERKRYSRGKRVLIEGQLLAKESFKTVEQPESTFEISGPIDCELLYIDMDGLQAPRGNYASTLAPLDYYTNDYYLFGGFGRFISVFKPKLKHVHTSPPTIGMSAIARIDDRIVKLMTNLELFVRYNRLIFGGFDSQGFDNSKYIWNMYRAQANKTVMLEGGPMSSALGFRIGGGLFNAFAGHDPVLLELARDKRQGLHDEHTFYPSIMPLQIVIIGNVAIVGVSGEPGNIAGQRIERTVQEVLKERGVERTIVNGYCNENTGYIFTPEEYEHQYSPQQCGFVLYGKWTCPVVRYQFEQLARSMLLPKEQRPNVLDLEIQPPQFSEDWYDLASYQDFLQPVKTRKEKKSEKKLAKQETRKSSESLVNR